MRSEGVPPGRAVRVARRECRESGDARRAAGRGAAAPGAERGRRGTAGELPVGVGHRPAGRAHAGRDRRRGVDAPVREHVGPGAGRRDRAGDLGSAVSRRFVALSTKRLEAFLDRPLGELDLRVVCIDGKVFRDHCMVVALGIDTAGRKHVLGLREGATETAAVTSGLLSDLVTRGLPTDRTLLFVIDGAPGLRRAITDVFGSRRISLARRSSRISRSCAFNRARSSVVNPGRRP